MGGRDAGGRAVGVDVIDDSVRANARALQAKLKQARRVEAFTAWRVSWRGALHMWPCDARATKRLRTLVRQMHTHHAYSWTQACGLGVTASVAFTFERMQPMHARMHMHAHTRTRAHAHGRSMPSWRPAFVPWRTKHSHTR